MSLYMFVFACVRVSVCVSLYTRTRPHHQIYTYTGSAEHQGLVGKGSVSSGRSVHDNTTTMQSQVVSVSVRLSDEVSGDIQVILYILSLSVSLYICARIYLCLFLFLCLFSASVSVSVCLCLSLSACSKHACKCMHVHVNTHPRHHCHDCLQNICI